MTPPAVRRDGFTSGGTPLTWGRAAQDGGLPFAGRPPSLPDAEAASRFVPAGEFHCRFFDLANPADRLDYEGVWTRHFNRRFRVVDKIGRAHV
mgnify:CR=1 FL=1